MSDLAKCLRYVYFNRSKELEPGPHVLLGVDIHEKINKKIAEYLNMKGWECKDEVETEVIEVNGRLADPEGINILNLLEGDVCELLMAIANAELSEKKFRFKMKASVVKYIVPKGYGTSPQPSTLRINTDNLPEDVKIFYGSVSGELNEVKMTHSRALAIYAEAETIWEASEKIEANLWRIEGEYEMRHDIGTKKSLAKKVEYFTLA